MKEKMKSLWKDCFGTTKRTVVTIVCIVAAIALLGTVTAYAAVRGTAIGAEAAQNYAFADAGVDPTAAENVQTEFSYESGQFVYDIEFTADDTEYEYWIKASDGTVVKKAMEIVTLDGATATVTASITVEEAKKIAFADAGVTEAEATIVKAELDYDDGLSVYDVEFTVDNVEYEYEVNANTGAIYSKSKETKVAAETNAETGNTTEAATEAANAENTESTTDNTSTTSGTTSSTGGTTTTTQIALDEAKKIALADAGVSASNVTFTKAKKDTDDGVAIYDIEFTTSTKEYEYEIKASDGTILDKSVETINSGSTSGTTGSTGGSTGTTTDTSYISLDEAKTIALNKAGLSASEVTFEKAKLEKDDGVMVYELEFYKGNMEYECTVNATTGAIIDYEVDVDD